MNFINWLRKKSEREEIHLRSKYTDPSRRFMEWVDELGFEQTRLGQWISFLEERFALGRLALLFLFSLALSLVIFYDFDFSFNASVGSIANTDIKSPISFQIVDEAATDAKRNDAEKVVPPVFDYDPEIYENALNNVYKSFRQMRRLVRESHWPSSGQKREEKIREFSVHKAQFEELLGVNIPDRIFEWLADRDFSTQIENILIRAMVRWANEKLMEVVPTLLPDPSATFIVRQVSQTGGGDEFTLTRAEVVDTRRAVEIKAQDIRGLSQLEDRDQQNTTRLIQLMLVPNLTLNRQETAARRQKAREAVLPVQLSISKNQVIVNEGSIIQPIHVTILNEIENIKSDQRTDLIALVAAALFVTLILVFFKFMVRFTSNRVSLHDKDIAVMALVTFMIVVMVKVFLFITDAAFLQRLGSEMPASVFLYAAPVAAGPMLIGLLVTSGEILLIFSIFLVVCLALMVDMNFSFLVVSLIGGITAARGVFSCKKRNDIYWAGLKTGFINALAILCIGLIQKVGDADLFKFLVWTVSAGFFGGIASAMVTMTFVPLLESLFNYTTDVKLLELSSLNHVLMKEMIVKAPGTYHHSLIVGSLVEAAAEEIGANALLAKVMAYYHDIGKMEHAQYFIENQRQGYNPHDNISPHMSRTILVAHVKDGAEMGIRHKLGKPIIDGILQHHGTTLISFFYNKALQSQDEEIDQVGSEEFRYPGPKPQFREAALVMLGDSIEAAARSLDEPTSARLQNLVKNIIQSKFLDGQLDECNLTLKDLSIIEATFKRVILGVYHQRIDYPRGGGMPQGKPNVIKKNFSA